MTNKKKRVKLVVTVAIVGFMFGIGMTVSTQLWYIMIIGGLFGFVIMAAIAWITTMPIKEK